MSNKTVDEIFNLCVTNSLISNNLNALEYGLKNEGRDVDDIGFKQAIREECMDAISAYLPFVKNIDSVVDSAISESVSPNVIRILAMRRDAPHEKIFKHACTTGDELLLGEIIEIINSVSSLDVETIKNSKIAALENNKVAIAEYLSFFC